MENRNISPGSSNGNNFWVKFEYSNSRAQNECEIGNLGLCSSGYLLVTFLSFYSRAHHPGAECLVVSKHVGNEKHVTVNKLVLRIDLPSQTIESRSAPASGSIFHSSAEGAMFVCVTMNKLAC